MRILLANTTAYPVIGGVENSLRFIGRELLRAGHQVRICCLYLTADEPLRMGYEGLEVLRSPYRLQGAASCIPNLSAGEDLLHFAEPCHG